jgi:thiol-disulfide isomerase/thioredoxin
MRFIRLSDYAGQVVVLNFWNTGCRACIPEKPILNRVAQEYSGSDVVFLGINPGEPPEQLLTFERRYGPSLYPQLKDRGNEVGESYELKGPPLHVVIDRTGNVAWWRPGGPISADVLVDVLGDVLAGRRPTAATSAAYPSD